MTGILAAAHDRARGLRELDFRWAQAMGPLLVLVAALVGMWWLAALLAGIGATLPLLARGRGPSPSRAPGTGRVAGPDLGRGSGSVSGSVSGSAALTALARARDAGCDPVCIRLRLVDPATGAPPDDAVMTDRAARLGRILRSGDTVEQQDPADLVIVLAPGPAPDLEDLVQLCARMQGAATAPDVNAVDAPPGTAPGTGRLAAVIGLCRGADLAAQDARAARNGPADVPTAAAILAAAAAALVDAQAEGAGTIRVFSARVGRRQTRRAALAEDAVQALDNGDIEAWFQPQVCTDTGRTSGFEALARWEHPRHGVVPPADFLPVLEAAGLLERLGTTMLEQAIRAVAAWDRDGFDVPSVGVNLSAADLRDPRLARRIAWMLDRHDLSGDRLTVEVLESVIADGGAGPAASPLLRNIAALAELGCGIDLDDFGTGHASITSLHRLAVSRVKIDRSFVTGIDRNRDRQKMLMTILSMCDHLGLKTLAEGVETPAEHAMVAQLGCHHVQGFGIGRPMRQTECNAWLQARRIVVDDALRQTRRHP